MHLLHLFLETCPTNNRTWNCAFLLCWHFLLNPFSIHRTCWTCTVMKLSLILIVVKFLKKVQTWGTSFIKSVIQFMSTPLLQVDKSFHFDNQGSHLIFWMRRRGRVAFASPVVLGGPVKSPVTVVHFVSAISCAFFAGAAFIIWLLLAWAINSLYVGPILTWPQNRTLNVGKPQTFGSVQWFSVSAV